MLPDAPIFTSYDLETDHVLDALRDRPDVEVVGLQFPDGLRDHATEISSAFEEALPELTFVVSADPTFGACDVAVNMEPYIDVLVHFGHTEMPSIDDAYGLEVHFVAARHRAPVEHVVVEAARTLEERTGGGTRFGLFTTAQHGHKLQEAADALANAGYEAVVGIGDDRVAGAGQVLGCNYTSATSVRDDVDGFIYIGSGDFHPVAVRFGTELPLVLADPYTETVRDVEETYERIMKQRFSAIAAAQDADAFGILVGTHVGQSRMRLAKGLQGMLRREGREAHLIMLQFFSWDFLQYFRHLDAFVNTGCPRISTDDYAEYPKPVLTPPELEIVLGRKSPDEYRFDEFMGRTPAPKGDDRIAIRSEPSRD